MKKSAFTIIELVFVIVVLGILASLAMGRMDRDLKQEASDTILSHIRLAQQLALRDNKHRSDNNPKWQTAYWRFEYEKCDGVDRYIYRVGSDSDLSGGINKIESAIDPVNGKYIWADGACDNFEDLASDESPDVFLYGRFGIEHVSHSTATGSCTTQNIGFDFLGRPHSGIKTYKTSSDSSFQKIMTRDCILTFDMSDGTNFQIKIEAETGHSFIVGQ
ncbi:Putative periplasmic ATP /GTP-binding protein [hydrothermal vent metagenome]|uniref:Putative periplasmic ATP /GTP-binding protein n=1 Tax=hydrothermal vent metagenome TaxID=652676 RepID=A0A1W1BZA5_9ZZZZ